jgi:hypothetical protein
VDLGSCIGKTLKKLSCGSWILYLERLQVSDLVQWSLVDVAGSMDARCWQRHEV